MHLCRLGLVTSVVVLFGCQPASGHSVVGTWVSSVNVVGRKAELVSTYNANGRFIYTTTMPLGNGKMVAVDKGTYEVKDDLLSAKYDDVDWTTEGLSKEGTKAARDRFFGAKSEMLASLNELEPRRLHWLSPNHFWLEIDGERVDCRRKIE